MSKSMLKSESSSVKDAMKEFYATEKLRRSTSSSPNSSGKIKNVNKHVSPSSVTTSSLKATPRNDEDSFGNQISKFFGGSPTNARDFHSTASSSSSDVMTNNEDQTEIAYLKNEMNSLQDMLEDSMTTLMTLNDKLQTEKDTNASLMRRAEEAEGQVEELSAHSKRQDQQIATMQKEIERLRRDSQSNRKTIVVSDDDEEESNKDDVKGNAIRQMSRVEQNDRRLAEVREDLNTNMRALSEQLCDGLVACDEEFNYLMERNPLFRGLAQPKPEPEPEANSKMDKKMFSPRNTSQPEGFLFGVPSTRFKVCQNAIRESEHSGEDDDEDTNECDEDYIDYGAEEYTSKSCGADSLSELEFGY